MPKDHVYASKTADADGLYSYDAEDDAVWGELFTRQMKALEDSATPDFLSGVEALGLTPERVPQIRDIDARLHGLSGAGAHGVPAIIPPKRFFTLLSQRKFPVATFLRRREDIDYIEEPDLFHEVFGHCPMLCNPAFADVIQRFGRIALSLPKGCNWHMFRLFWFTVEFGMIRTPAGLRAYGAGIVSSPSELAHAMSGAAQMQPFEILTALRTPYRIDIVQPLYFVIDHFDDLLRNLDADIPGLIAQAQAMGDLPPLFDPA